MCIACELGYWSMLDALEAERRACREKDGPSDETGFLCDTPGEPLRHEPRVDATLPVDEPRRE
jgi:hypothetical protein